MSRLKPLGDCCHCRKPIYDNGSVAIHVNSNELILSENQFCDERKLTIAETQLSEVSCVQNKIGTFDVLKVMTDRNLDVRLSTLDNITDLEFCKGNTFIRIGFSGNVMGIAKGEFIGGFLIARKEQWEQIKKELEKGAE